MLFSRIIAFTSLAECVLQLLNYQGVCYQINRQNLFLFFSFWLSKWNSLIKKRIKITKIETKSAKFRGKIEWSRAKTPVFHWIFSLRVASDKNKQCG